MSFTAIKNEDQMTPNKESLLAEKDIKSAVKVLRSVNHPFRKELLELLQKNGKMTVTEIYEMLQAEQSVVSQQLGILRSSGVVATSRQGRHIFYQLDQIAIARVNRGAGLLAAH